MKSKIIVALMGALLLALTSCTPSPTADPAAASDLSAEEIAGLGGEANVELLNDLYAQAVEADQTTITVYGVTATSSAPLYEAFQERYPEITVDHVTIFGPELQSRVSGEQATGQNLVDQVSVSGADAIYLAEKELISTAEVPIAEALDPLYKPVGETLFGGSSYLYTVSYNTELVTDEEAPKNFQDLLDPKWAGKIGISDPASPNGFIALPIRDGSLDEQWLTDFKATNPVIVPSEHELFNAVSTGQVPIGIGTWTRGAGLLEADDLPVKFVAPFEGGMTDGVFYRGTVEGAPNKIASDLLLNWWFTPQAQQLIAEQGQQGLMPDAPPIPGIPALNELKINKAPEFDDYSEYYGWAKDLFDSVFK